MKPSITIEFENDKKLRKFVSEKLMQLRDSEWFKNENVDFFLTWEEPLG